MKMVQWKVVVTDGNIATMENAKGFPQDSIESHLVIIGLLENIKQKHLEKMKTLFEKSVKDGGDE
jgi:hypothetical protein